jgi:hypothetical protein
MQRPPFPRPFTAFSAFRSRPPRLPWNEVLLKDTAYLSPIAEDPPLAPAPRADADQQPELANLINTYTESLNPGSIEPATAHPRRPSPAPFQDLDGGSTAPDLSPSSCRWDGSGCVMDQNAEFSLGIHRAFVGLAFIYFVGSVVSRTSIHQRQSARNPDMQSVRRLWIEVLWSCNILKHLLPLSRGPHLIGYSIIQTAHCERSTTCHSKRLSVTGHGQMIFGCNRNSVRI